MDRPDPIEYEEALKRLPLAYSLALRLRDSGVDDAMICEYLAIEPEGLATLMSVARRKLYTELNRP